MKNTNKNEGFWKHVAVLRCGKEVKIIITLQCPFCGGDVVHQWQGSPGEIYPDFKGSKVCLDCDKKSNDSIPKKSIVRWWYLAKIEAYNCWYEEEHRYITPRSNVKKNKRKKRRKSSTIADIMERGYRRLLQDSNMNYRINKREKAG